MLKYTHYKYMLMLCNVNQLNIATSPPNYHQISTLHNDGIFFTIRPFSTKPLSTIEKLFSKLATKSNTPNNKITIVGSSSFTGTAAFTLLAKKITNEICIIDINDDRLRAEQMDLQFGSMHLGNAKIIATKDHSESANSKICVIAAGTLQAKQESRGELITRNSGIIQAVIPPLVKHSPNAILIVASEPVDVLTHLTWKTSGLPMNRVIGTGTSMDSEKFRYLLAEKLRVAPTSCLGYIIGERGETSVPVWSGVNVAGVRLMDMNPNIGTTKDIERWQDLHKKVVTSDGILRKQKGINSWAYALTIANLCEAVLGNAHSVHTVSTYARGEHRILDEVFLSLPCVVGRAGITDVIRQQLSEHEASLLRKSVDSVLKSQESIKLLD